MLRRLHHLLALLLLVALPLKGIAAVLMPACPAMAAAAESASATVPPCHDAAASDEASGTECCSCAPCLAPMLATMPATALPSTDRVESRPAITLAPRPDAAVAVPRPPPRT